MKRKISSVLMTFIIIFSVSTSIVFASENELESSSYIDVSKYTLDALDGSPITIDLGDGVFVTLSNPSNEMQPRIRKTVTKMLDSIDFTHIVADSPILSGKLKVTNESSNRGPVDLSFSDYPGSPYSGVSGVQLGVTATFSFYVSGGLYTTWNLRGRATNEVDAGRDFSFFVTDW